MSIGRLVSSIGGLAVGAALLGGCGTPAPGGGSPAVATASAAATAAPPVVAVALKEFSVTPQNTSAPAGRVTLRVQNSGALQHELLVVRSDVAATALPLKDGKDLDPSKVEVVAQTPPFDAGQSRELPVTLTAGTYVLLCNVSGHYLTGMAVAFTVR